MRKATNHPRINFEVMEEFKQNIVDICKATDTTMTDYVMDVLEPKVRKDLKKYSDLLAALKAARKK